MLRARPAMELPEFLLGTYSEVKPRVRRFVKTVASGGLPDVRLVDTKTNPGLLVLDDTFDGYSAQRHFQLYAVLAVPTDKEEYGILSGLFDWLLSVPWGPLSLMGEDASLLRVHRRLTEQQWTAFLVSVVKQWPSYTAEGARYTAGTAVQPLWALPTTLLRELTVRGLSSEEIRTRAPNESLKDFLLRHADKFGDVLAQIAEPSARG